MEPLLSGNKKHKSQPHLKESTSQNISKDSKLESRLELDEYSPDLSNLDKDATGMNGTNLCSSSVIPITSGCNLSNSVTLNSDNTGSLPMGNGPGSCNVQPVTSSFLSAMEGSHHGRANSSCSHPRNGENQLSSLSSVSSPFPETSAQSSSSLPQDVTPSNCSAINRSPHGDQKQHSSIRTLHPNSTNQHPVSSTTTTTTTSGRHTKGNSIIASNTATVPPLSTTLVPSSTSITTSKSSDDISTNCPQGKIGSGIKSDPKNTSPKPRPTEFAQKAPLQQSCDDGIGNSTSSDVVQTKENQTAINGKEGAPWATTTTAENNDLSKSSGSIEQATPSVTCLPLKNQDLAVGVDQGVV